MRSPIKLSYLDCEELLTQIEQLESKYEQKNLKIPKALGGDYAEFKVLSMLLKKGFPVEHVGGGYAYDILLKPDIKIEIKYSRKQKGATGGAYWEWSKIDPDKFKYLVLVGEDEDHTCKFFIFDSEESKKHIPPVAYNYKPEEHRRSVKIFESKESWKNYVQKWNPHEEHTRRYKEQTSNEDSSEGFINTHIDCFENKWEKIK
ncbi:MAG: hypothetical protein Q7J54_02395 [Candidatus Woesearchaeota archaeon]|nr:hypothetical protein [Candidatus Woesearchaeota archaeon]